MPQPYKRSRTLRRIKVKTPGGRNIVHYLPRQPGKAHCAGCRKPLAGVARARPTQLNKLSKTEKRPERPFGGVLCSSCMRAEIRQRVRGPHV